MSNTERLMVNQLVLSEEVQTRTRMDAQSIEEYAELYRRQKEEKKLLLPPVAVWRVGKAHYVVDGFHRVSGAIVAGISHMTAIIAGEGTLEDARLDAIKYNQKWGVKLTPEDRRKTVMRAIELKPEWSDSLVAEHCGTSKWTVQRARESIKTTGASAPVEGLSVGNDSCGEVSVCMDSDGEISVMAPGEPPFQPTRAISSVGERGFEDAVPGPMSEPSKNVAKERKLGKDGKWRSANPERAGKVKTAAKDDQLIVEAAAEIRKARLTIKAWIKKESDDHIRTAIETAMHDLDVAAQGLSRRQRVACPECDGLVKQFPHCNVCGSRRWVTVGNAQNLKPRK